jgi:hypothetical protein
MVGTGALLECTSKIWGDLCTKRINLEPTYQLLPRTTSFSYARWDTRPLPRIFVRSFCFTGSRLVEYPRQHNWRIVFMLLLHIFKAGRVSQAA